MALHDIPIWFPAATRELQIGVASLEIVSSAVVAGLGGWMLGRALRRTGALQSFPSDR